MMISSRAKSYPTLFGLMWKHNCPLKPITCYQSISMRFNSGLWLDHSKTFFSLPDMPVHFGSLSCYITQVHLSFMTQTDVWMSPSGFYGTIHGYINYSHLFKFWPSRPRPSHYHHHAWLFVWKKVWSIHRKSRFLLANRKWALVIFLRLWDFCLRTLPWMPFLPRLFLVVDT